MLAFVLASILIAGQIPPLGNVGTCSRPAFVVQADSAWFHMRWYGAPPPYRWLVEDSTRTARTDSVGWRFDTSNAVGRWAPPFGGCWLYTQWVTRTGRICRNGHCADTLLVGCGHAGFVRPDSTR